MTSQFVIEAYNPDWSNYFREEANCLQSIFQDELLVIHHVGSTSIPGLAAKPIIDIIPVVKDIVKVDFFNNEMIRLGYEVKGEYGMLFRRFFQKRTAEKSFNIHMYEPDNAEIPRLLLFKNYLIENPLEKKRYADLKRLLAKKHSNNIIAYCEEKSDFINRIDNLSGFKGVRIVQVLTEEEHKQYHRIAQEEIYDKIGIEYDSNHSDLSPLENWRFVLRKDTDIVGALHIESLENQDCVLRQLAIKAEFQKQGLGSHFLVKIERWLCQQGKKRILLHSNQSAITFYHRLGYQNMLFDKIDKDSVHSSKMIDMGKILA